MAFNALTSRSDVAALIPEDVSREILSDLASTGWLLGLARRLPDLPRAQRRMPVLSTLPVAYFVDGDTGLKQTTEAAWANKYIDAEELAVIVPIPQSVLDDADYDIWAEIRPLLVDAFNNKLAGAVLYGTDIPATWTTNLGAAGIRALAAARTAVVSIAGFADLYEAILGESAAGAADGLLAVLEADGYQATAHVGHISMRTRLRNCRDADGNPVFHSLPAGQAARYQLDGADVWFPADGVINSAQSLLITGQWNQLVYAMRQDITYTIATEGVIQDAAGNIVYNLFQRDMVALRAVMRIGFALPNPINYVQPTEASRCPFAVLVA
ncbi:MAG: phage major capsid protein [Chloroflexi bacterium]|nr:phage major capsid protein [Chloroflexota bacterium]